MKKKSLVGWATECVADTLIIFKGAENPFKGICAPEYYGAKKVRITIEEVKCRAKKN